MIQPLIGADLADQEKYFMNLPRELKNAIIKYTTTKHTSLNTLLKKGLNIENSNHSLSFPTEVQWVKLIDQVISEAPKINKTFYVYYPFSEINHGEYNKEYNGEYVSASLNPTVEGDLFKIIVTPSVSYLYVETLQEIVFQRNTHFKMLSVETIKQYYPESKDHRLVKLYTVMIEPGHISSDNLVQKTTKDGSLLLILESFTRYIEKMDVHLYYENHENIPLRLVEDYIQEHPQSVIPVEMKPEMLRIARKLVNSF